ncbi:MAG: class I SAM-dependent methyltransferase [Anaerolineales bacterium]
MPEKILHSLAGVPQTLLMTLLVRARETQRPDGAFKDEKSVEMMNCINADFSKLRMQRHDEIAVIIRMKRFDRHVRDFLARNPDGVVVHIGCGLDTRYERIGNDYVEWFDLDVPEVMDLRKKLISTQSSHYHAVTASVFDMNWFAEVERFKPRPFLFVAEGVLPYFEETQVKELFLRLSERFPGCEFVCDAHTPFVIWADNLHLAFAGVKARLHWKLRDPRDVETWCDGFHLLDEWNYYADDEPLMKPFLWMRAIPALARSSGIYHYRLGETVIEMV